MIDAQTLVNYLEKAGIKLVLKDGDVVVSKSSTRQLNQEEQGLLSSNLSGVVSILSTRKDSTSEGEPEKIVYGPTGTGNLRSRTGLRSDYVWSFNGNTGDVQGVSSWNGQTGGVSFYDYVSSFNGHTGAVHGVSTWNGQTGDVIYVDQNENTGILFGGGITAAVGSTAFTVYAGAGQIVGYTNGMGGATATITAVT
jgi:hypothetical protein